MGQINIIEELRKDNPRSSDIDLKIYTDALRDYDEASANIAKHGTICSHPRTGTPIENPYLKIRSTTAKVLSGMARIKSDRVVKLLASESVPSD